jgi:serine hydrolase FSH1
LKDKSLKYLQVYLTIISLIYISSCVDSRVKVETDAVKAGFHNQTIETKFFNLFTSIKIKADASDKIVFYIEGDGHAWKHRNKLSDDPTPKNPISLKLALNDSRSNVVYLARPCQYIEKSKRENCFPKYWSSHRYSKQVVESMNEAITKIKSQTGTSKIELIGFSGGGVIAILIAAKRNDVSKVTTVAANIDHESWSEWHEISNLGGSLTPMDHLSELKSIKQFHYWGSKDDIVPYKTQSSFIAHFENNPLFNYRVIPGFTHDCCWVEYWQENTIY